MAMAAPPRVALFVPKLPASNAKEQVLVDSQFEKLESLIKSIGVEVVKVTAPDILRGALNPSFCCLVVPGGACPRHAREFKFMEGRRVITSYIAAGGTYVGICAGAYLGLGPLCPETLKYPGWDLVHADVLDVEHWERGCGLTKVKLSQEGQALLSIPSDSLVDMLFTNGPLIKPRDSECKVLASFQSEPVDAAHVPDAVFMSSTPAVVYSNIGQGKAVLFATHPEDSPANGSAVLSAVLKWICFKVQQPQLVSAPVPAHVNVGQQPSSSPASEFDEGEAGF